MKKIIVAIDGYSSSGKSTMARELARRIGYVYVDSGQVKRGRGGVISFRLPGQDRATRFRAST